MDLGKIVAFVLLTAVALGAMNCAHRGPVVNTVITCGKDELEDPTLVDDVAHALVAPDWRGAVAGLVNVGLGRTENIIACVLRSLVLKAKASPGGVRGDVPEHAQIYLDEKGYRFKD